MLTNPEMTQNEEIDVPMYIVPSSWKILVEDEYTDHWSETSRIILQDEYTDRREYILG